MRKPNQPKWKASQNRPNSVGEKSVTSAPNTVSAQRSNDCDRKPSSLVRSVLSILVLLHLFAISVSFLAVVEPSETQTAILQKLSPYLWLTHFGAGDEPVYLAHANASEQPHRLQVFRGRDSEQWETIEPTGVAGLSQSDRDARWLRTLANFAENEQPGIVASLLIPELERLLVDDPARPIKQIRIVRLPTDLTTVLDDAQPPPYQAAVVVTENRVELIQVKEARLSAMAKESFDSNETDEESSNER